MIESSILEWLKGLDAKGNTCWVAQSCLKMHGKHQGYQVTSLLKEDRVQWSLRESGIDLIDGLLAKEFASLEEAKQVCEACEKQMIEDVKAGCYT